MRRRTPIPLLVLLLIAANRASAADFGEHRERMVRYDIASRGIKDEAVLEAMRTVPRHLFVPEAVNLLAYQDHPLPIGKGQTISQPYVVALMTEALELAKSDRTLEIGTGSGYQAAILAEIVDEVYSLEIIPELAASARKNLDKTGYGSVKTRPGDGYYGWKEAAPFDAIIITAAANHIPPPLLDQLADGGRLILPLGRTTHVQVLTLVTRRGDTFLTTQMGGVRFVPMVGEAQKDRPASDAVR